MKRIWFVGAVFLVGYGALLFHLYELQIKNSQYYLARAESQLAAGLLRPPRGVISFTDRDGEHLAVATEKPYPIVYAVPRAIEDAQEAANVLAPVLGLPAEDILKKLSKPNDDYELLLKKTTDDIGAQVEGLAVKGVYVDRVSSRFYPLGPLGAHVLGFVGPNEEDLGESGHYGIEAYYDKMLSGAEDGGVGRELALSIDSNVEVQAERILSDLVKAQEAKGGTVIVQDPKTGKILAMGSVPSFDPNRYSDANFSELLNPAVERIYEPGSVMKVLTMSGALDAGKVTPETTFYDPGSLTLNGKKIQNWDLKAHGTVTMTNIIELSLNTGAAFVERTMGNDVFKAYLERFGLGEKTGIDLPGELRGSLKQLNPKAPAIAYATAAFGQGVSATPLQMINAFSAIANGGMLMKPSLDANAEPRVLRRVIQPETAEKITKMMISAVDKGKVAVVNGYKVAGKTGTAQAPDLVHGGYSDQFIHTYIGFAPASNPRFTVLLKLDEPKGALLAGGTVVPAFRDLAGFLLNYYNATPDRP